MWKFSTTLILTAIAIIAVVWIAKKVSRPSHDEDRSARNEFD